MIKKIIVLLLVFSLGFIAGWFVPDSRLKNIYSQITSVRAPSSGFDLVNPLLASDGPVGDYTDIRSLKEKIQELISDKYGDEQVGLYFRENSTRWIAINDQYKFAPASLLKVPMMMAYYKLAEANPDILKNKLQFNADQNLNDAETIKPSQNLVKGEFYTIDELIRRMIVYSDNNALGLLSQNIDVSNVQDVFTTLGLHYPGNDENSDIMSPKDYSLFFRVLYNVTYLNDDYSRKALGLLTQSDYKQGVASGVDQNIRVAHKFGERETKATDGSVSVQFHDCGFVYNPQQVYLLCVMTKGSDLSKQQQVVNDIGNLVFHEVKKHK